MDLEFILEEMEIAADPFALCELHGQCDLGLDKDPSATLHYILAGSGEILIPGQSPVIVRRGSLVLIPALRQHILRSHGEIGHPVPACRPAGLQIAHVLQKAGNADGRLIALCAHINLSLRKLQNLMDLVRVPIVYRADQTGIVSFLATVSAPKVVPQRHPA